MVPPEMGGYLSISNCRLASGYSNRHYRRHMSVLQYLLFATIRSFVAVSIRQSVSGYGSDFHLGDVQDFENSPQAS